MLPNYLVRGIAELAFEKPSSLFVLTEPHTLNIALVSETSKGNSKNRGAMWLLDGDLSKQAVARRTTWETDG